MLVGGEPRGLPGTLIDKIALQRSGEGFPLDDVVVHAHNTTGVKAILEVQVKRSATFAPQDQVFADVVQQIVEAAGEPGFWDTRHELAVAIGVTSRQISGPYQDTLSWARAMGDAASFFASLNRPGTANTAMRTFVDTVRARVSDASGADDHETIWRLLQRFQILVFDYTALHSASETLAKERAARALHPDDAGSAGALWSTLVRLAISRAADGGEFNKASLEEALRQEGFRLAGDRRHSVARAIIAEDAEHALSDIGDRIAGVVLPRARLVAEVDNAWDTGRYIEIRGDAGVGKSGILKRIAKQMSAEARIVVLAPGRVKAGGWPSMGAAIGFEGTAREFLVDLALDGGSTVFIDNLDSFDAGERLTVSDLIREASGVPGVRIVATARTGFGMQEPSWLPPDAITALGAALIVGIKELGDDEIEELKVAIPAVAGLLAPGHPARVVVRNLFRLGRLAQSTPGGDVPRTEVEMALDWWRSAGGRRDDQGHRERARVLRALAEQALGGPSYLDASEQPAAALDALIANQSLKDLDDDRVAFRHDVLREWGIANLLATDPTLADRLHLDQPASASNARGVELLARIGLEGTGGPDSWREILDRMSQPGVHITWRRAVLMSLVRSELESTLLARVWPLLVADDAALLRELLRTVVAVDVQPASEMIAALGLGDEISLPNSFVPVGPSWRRLLVLLLAYQAHIPPSAFREVTALFQAWSFGTFGVDPITPKLMEWTYARLAEIESAFGGEFTARYSLYDGKIPGEELQSLRDDLRTIFLLFCRHVPKLASDYLKLVTGLDRDRDIVSSILKFRGSLAQAAPAELAELTATALIGKEPRQRSNRRDALRDRPFEYVEHDFMPASPSQGPFYELLVASPGDGLALVHRIAKHAVEFQANGQSPDDDLITVELSAGPRDFPWTATYSWPRDARSFALTSALMALEAWGHERIEAGDDIADVVEHVLGPPDSCCAFLLIAVDLIISHWPKSRAAAVPLVGCPELLCIDRERQALEAMADIDLFGLKALQKEPVGGATLASLKKRTSRRAPLERLLAGYVFGESPERENLIALLEVKAAALGAIEGTDSFAVPRFMARHALNELDPANWPEGEFQQDDGTTVSGRYYNPPQAEAEHLLALNRSNTGVAEFNTRTRLALALSEPSKSSSEFAASAADLMEAITPEDIAADDLRRHDVATAAMVVMRDGTADVRSAKMAWALDVFEKAKSDDDDVARMRNGLRFNSPAIAFVGLAEIFKVSRDPEIVRLMLGHAASKNPAVAHGVISVARELAEIDERMVRSILRCGMAACVRPQRQWDRPEAETEAHEAAFLERLNDVVEQEATWLAENGREPQWPEFVAEIPSARRRRRIGQAEPIADSQRPERSLYYSDHHAGALWLNAAAQILVPERRGWLREMIRSYADWTAKRNGCDLDHDTDLSSPPSEWNGAYFNLLARCLDGLSEIEIDDLALKPIVGLPDSAFFDVTMVFMASVDVAYLDHHELKDRASAIRQKLAARMMESQRWIGLSYNPGSTGIEMRLGPAIGALFLNSAHGFGSPTVCYVPAGLMPETDVFLDTLKWLALDRQNLFIAIVTMNFLEVAPRFEQLDFALSAFGAWLAAFAKNAKIWVDHGIGRRVSAWLSAVLTAADRPIVQRDDRTTIDLILAELVRIGVPEARQLESTLASLKPHSI